MSTTYILSESKSQGMVGMSRIFTLWSSVCMYVRAQLTDWVNPSHHPQGMLEWARIAHYDNQCVHTSTTYILCESKSPSKGHCWNEQDLHIIWSSMCTHQHNLQAEWIRVTKSTGHGWNEQTFHIMIISVYTWVQFTEWIRVTKSTGHDRNGQNFHIMIISVYTWPQPSYILSESKSPSTEYVGMSKNFTLCAHTSTTYILSESKSPTSQGMVGTSKIMIIIVYTWAQLTD